MANMIPPSLVHKMANFSTEELHLLFVESGYTGVKFLNSQFSGVNSSGEHVYSTTMPDDSVGVGTLQVPVFVKYDFQQSKVTADF